jgi:predicted transcriptional regulator
VNHPDHQPSESCATIRMDARLDATTRAKVDELAKQFHQPRAAVLCHIMRWGLTRGQAEMLDGGASEGPVRHLSLYVDTALYDRVEEAAIAAGVKNAPWLRSMVRQISLTDFPASWHADQSEERSHDSRVYDTRFMLRLDKTSQTRLQQLIMQLGASKAEIIRQLILHATPEDFPTSWHMRSHAGGARQARQESIHADREPRSQYPVLG